MTTLTFGERAIEVTNPDKVFWPDEGITKGDLVDHYVRVAVHLLPHVAGRPLTMVRCPDGIDGNRWFQKDAAGTVPDWVPTATLGDWEGGDVRHAVADGPAALAALAQLAAIELHTGLSPVNDPAHPAEIVFDLDPPGRRDAEVRAAARWVRDLLEDELELATGVKTSGSKGFHIHVPLDGSDDVETVRAFAEAAAETLTARHPDALTVEFRKAKRHDRILVDWFRNHPAQTVVAPYSVRAKPGAPVATPLDWGELSEGVAPDQYTMRSIFRRLGQRDDPWAGLRDHEQRLGKAVDRIHELAQETRT